MEALLACALVLGMVCADSISSLSQGSLSASCGMRQGKGYVGTSHKVCAAAHALGRPN